jgi:serine/threonine protein kinase
MPDPLVGTLVDDWKIVKPLGEGAMGTVYEAQRGPHRAAFKIAHAHKLSSDSLERFRREAQILMQIEDPYVVRCFAAGESEGFAYLALEYMEGGTVQGLLERRGPLGVPQAVGLARRVLRGLAAVHRGGILHRDVKPDNVLLDARGRPKLADFGMARHKDHRRITATGTILGTADYMAPEQFMGDTVDHRADLYATGALLYHLLTGKPPYEGRSSLAVLKKHQDAPIPDPADVVPAAKALTPVVKRLMAKKASDRPADADQALKLFEGMTEKALGGSPLTPLFGLKPLARLASQAGGPSRILDLLCLGALLLAGALSAHALGYGLLASQIPWPRWALSLQPHFGWVWPLVDSLALLLLLDRVVARRRGHGLLAGITGRGPTPGSNS